ncbi:MAG: hypothetical protein ACOC1K_02075 [Nanoarchaeota archaeon]
MKNNISEIALNELNELIEKEYLIPLNEGDDEDGIVKTPFKRAASYPLRAIRYRKAKNVLKGYIRKLYRRSKKLIKSFKKDIDKALDYIKKKNEIFQKELEEVKQTNDSIKKKKALNQIKNFKREIIDWQEKKMSNLNSSFDSLISVYTDAINKRIESEGYVLKVELSEKGKANLKILWQEYITVLKQKIYGDLFSMINDVTELEYIIAQVNAEIEEAEDQRRKIITRSRRNEETPEFKKKTDARDLLKEKLKVDLDAFFEKLSKSNNNIYVKSLGKSTIQRYRENLMDVSRILTEYLYEKGTENAIEYYLNSKTIPDNNMYLLLKKASMYLEDVGKEEVYKKKRERIIKEFKSIKQLYKNLKNSGKSDREIAFQMLSYNIPNVKKLVEDTIEAKDLIIKTPEKKKLFKETEEIWQTFNKVSKKKDKMGSEIIKMIQDFYEKNK